MDWKKLREDALVKASEYAEKAKKLSTDVANKTRVTIKTEDEYAAFLAERKSVLVAGTETCEPYRLAIVRYPELVAKAWTESASLRYLDTALYPDFSQRFGIVADDGIVVILFRQGQEVARYRGAQEVSAIFSGFAFPS